MIRCFFVRSDQEAWNSLEGSTCNGHFQSPIDIRSEITSSTEELDLTVVYSAKTNLNFVNNGHTLQASPFGGYVPLEVNFNKTKYNFAQMHFHWSEDPGTGTEHSFDGQQNALEVHFVSYNSKYENFAQAASQQDGLLVLAVLGEEKTNSSFNDDWLRSLSDLRYAKSEGSTNGSDITELIPRSPFIVYKGSLTTPPCSETVTWVVSTAKFAVSKKTMYLFRRVYAVNENGENYSPKSRVRAIQPLNGRSILQSTQPLKVIQSSASVIQLTSALLPTLLFLNYFYY